MTCSLWEYKFPTETKQPMNLHLKMAIVASGKTQIAIAKRIGLTEPQMSRIVHGHDEPSDETKKALARILRRPVHELFPEVAA